MPKHATSFTVATGDLHAALRAVRVHAGTDRDAELFRRVRLAADPQHVTVMATDTQTTGYALVSVLEHVNPGIDMIDLYPSDVARILSVFGAGREGPDEEAPQYQLRIELEPRHVSVVDASGMFDGRAMRVPRLASVDVMEFDEIPQTISKMHHAFRSDTFDTAVLDGDLLARFVTAASVYAKPIQIGSLLNFRSLMVRCGESFLGTMWPAKSDEDAEQMRAEWAIGWSARLPDPKATTRTGEL